MIARSTYRKLVVAALLLCGSAAWGREPQKVVSASGKQRASAVAADLFFRDSDPDRARAAAAQVLKRHPANVEALFVEMEAAAFEADTSAELQAAVRLAETRIADPRVTIAAARILDLAGNTSAFRAVAPRIRALAHAKSVQVNYFRSALLTAATDGLPGDSVHDLAREAGLLTDWRVAGPFGRFSNVDFDRSFEPEHDGLGGGVSGTLAVESVRLDDGNFILPDYFDRRGVYYAASEFTSDIRGEYVLRADSAGTLAIAIDGRTVLQKDDRFRVSPGNVWSRVVLAAGTHRVLVKFLPSAAPFRIALLRSARVVTPHPAPPMYSAAETEYVAAAGKYWTGDYAGAIQQLQQTGKRSAAQEEFLLAHAWAHEQDSDAPEAMAALNAAIAASPRALAAETMLAENAYSGERVDDALDRLRHVLAVQPDYLPAQELRSEIAVRFDWQAEAEQAIDARVRLHPNCSTLRDAANFYSRFLELRRAAELQQRLDGCSPSSLAYVEALGDAGRHREAATAAAAKVAARPFDRNARSLLVRELRLAGDSAAAKQAADELAALAPNSEPFRKIALAAANKPLAPVEDENERSSGFVSGDAFYTHYRRDGLDILKRTKTRRFSGGPAVILLHDRVVNLAADGSAAVYEHKITRLLTRAGIERYGEVAVPGGADLLELRTLKADGNIVEPEFLEHKATVSMPALARGDAIEVEYVRRFPAPAVSDNPDAFQFVFGSFQAPILFSRFVVLTAGAAREFAVSAGVQDAQVQENGAVRVWEKNDIPQSTEETAMPTGESLPNVRVLPRGFDDWQAVREYYRDTAIDLTRAGSRVEQVTSTVGGTTPEEKARALYRLVTSTIRNGGSFGEGATSAEDTLAGGQGSRTATLLALSRAAGLDAELVLAREIDSQDAQRPSIQAYSRPLVRFSFSDKQVLVDAEAEGAAFGAVPPSVDRTRALVVPLKGAADEPMFVALADRPENERSLANGEITLGDHGDLSADLEITMGASRSAQMRSILRGIPADGRQHFFEQLAMRIFPGATDVHGDVRDESNPDRPLVLHVVCRSPRFFSFNGRSADLDQIVPALNLRKLYVGTAPRQLPLYVDAPLFETATFRVHLPADTRLLHRADDLEEHNQFGDYAVRFRELEPGLLEITRSFRIPVQVIAPAQYPEFVRFATRVDNAERQRLSVQRVQTSARSARP